MDHDILNLIYSGHRASTPLKALIRDYARCVEALEIARKRVDYLGIHAGEKDYVSNIKDFLPIIDDALTLSQAHRELIDAVGRGRE